MGFSTGRYSLGVGRGDRRLEGFGDGYVSRRRSDLPIIIVVVHILHPLELAFFRLLTESAKSQGSVDGGRVTLICD